MRHVSADDVPARMPPPTILARHLMEVSANSSDIAVVKDRNLKMYHVMSVKQSLREDLAEHSYQFSCRAADWSRSAFSSVPMQFEPLKLHIVDALGQQEVPDYLQQPAKAITEDVGVMRGPQAQEWIHAVREEIASFKRLGVYEEVPRKDATSTPLPARLILVTKPNVHGGPARKKASIVICGNFQEVHPRSLKWTHEEIECRLLPCQGSPCLWTVVPIRPGEDPSVKTSKEELTRGVIITFVDDLLLTGWQYHIDAIRTHC